MTSLVLVLTAGLLPTLRNAERAPLTDSARAQAPGQFVRLAHGQVHYALQGPQDGPVVVFVHGFSVPSYTWNHNTAPLADAGFRVLSFDLYGRGYSDRPLVAYDRGLFTSQLTDLLDALELRGALNLVGISMGGAIVAAFAAEHPERVRSLVFLAPFNSPVDIGPLSMPLIGEYLAYAFVVPGLADKQRQDLTDPDRYPEWVDQFREQTRYDGFRRTILATARDFIQTDPMVDFAGVGERNTQSLLLWGDSDTTFPIEQSDRVRAALGRNHVFRRVDNAGHALHYERPEAVNRELLAFLRGNGNDIPMPQPAPR